MLGLCRQFWEFVFLFIFKWTVVVVSHSACRLLHKHLILGTSCAFVVAFVFAFVCFCLCQCHGCGGQQILNSIFTPVVVDNVPVCKAPSLAE